MLYRCSLKLYFCGNGKFESKLEMFGFISLADFNLSRACWIGKLQFDSFSFDKNELQQKFYLRGSISFVQSDYVEDTYRYLFSSELFLKINSNFPDVPISRKSLW